jgi:glycosyltransferase involved in cell wall biosynthesis
MKNKNIIIGINASFARKPNTGIGQVTLNFLRKLSELKVKSEKLKDIEFFIYLEEAIDLKLPDNFQKRIFLPIWKRDDLIRKIWWEKCLLPRQIKKDKCDILISLYQCPTRTNIKHLMFVHDIIPELFPEYLNNFRKKKYWKMTKNGIAAADKIIAISRRTEKDLIQHFNIQAEKISVNYFDADPIYKKNISQKESARILRKYKLKPGYILAGGGMEARKNVEGVIRAYKFLHDKFKLNEPLPKLIVYGKLLPQLAPLITDAEKLIRELNLTKFVKLLDAVPQEDLPALFKNAAMFLYPSFYEGFGLPILEAMSQGTPVIASKTSSLPEVGSDAILYCDPDDIRDIAMVMRNILFNQDLRETLSRRGKERAKEFSWEKFTKKIMNILKGL